MKRFWILPLLISVGGCVTQKPEASQNPSTSQILSDLDTRGRRQEEEIKILNQQVAELRGEYVLQAGDTLKKVANRFGLTLEASGYT
jgi:LysM repeat protein